jgi:Tol biopolymer transport system component
MVNHLKSYGLKSIILLLFCNVTGSGAPQIAVSSVPEATLRAARLIQSHGVDEATNSNDSPVFSPDGTHIAFVSDISGNDTIWIMDADGRNVKPLISGAGLVTREPAWSPDGKLIALSMYSANGADIWILSLSDGKLTQLTRQSGNNEQPSWSPNGMTIAFVSDRSGTNDIWTMDPGGANLSRLTTQPGHESHPSFSPDGTRVVFCESLADSSQLYVANANGSGLTQLTAAVTGREDVSPSWSISGIVFSSNRDGYFHLWSLQDVGSTLLQVTSGVRDDFEPSWSSDGTMLAMSSASPTDTLAGVWISNKDGSLPRQLTSVGFAPSLVLALGHSGVFKANQINAAYTIDVGNMVSAGPTSGVITATESLPTGLVLVSMSGTGWNCTATSALTA